MSFLKEKYTQEFIKTNNLILAEVIIGSYAFDLHTPKSDRDLYGIYHLTKEDFYSLHYRADKSYNNVVEKTNPKDQDITYIEVGKFFELLGNGNPNVLEMLAAYQNIDNVVNWNDKSHLIDEIDISKILSKKCHKSFGEYAQTQIKKARGLNKKIVNPVEPERKTPIDFCYLLENGRTTPLRQYLIKRDMDQKFCGVVALTNAKDSYAIYYDIISENLFGSRGNISEASIENIKEERRNYGFPMGYGFKGIELENSNEIRLSSVPKDWYKLPMDSLNKKGSTFSPDIEFIGHFSYNKDGYVQHCKDYREYWEWAEKRNPERYNNNLKQNYDTKNISHCVRLLSVAQEIAQGKGIILKRTHDRQFLMDIKLGNVEYDVAMEYAQNIANSLEELYKNSSLPDDSDFLYLNDKLIEIRKKLYDK